MRVLISGNSEGFRNPSVDRPMLLSSYALQFMSWCSQLIASDCVQRLELFQFGVIKFLLHFLRSHECSEEISETILLLSVQALSFACDRESFEEFFSLFEGERFMKGPLSRHLFQYFQSAMLDDPLS
jgi:hypothetical protein